MTTKTIRKQPAQPRHFTSAVNFDRPWAPTTIENGNTVLDWHGNVVLRIETKGKSAEQVRATRELVTKAVNAFDAAMRVVNLAALMKHTCEKREGGRTVTVHECNRCLAEIAQARAGQQAAEPELADPYTVAAFSRGDFAVTGQNPCAICARDIKDKKRAIAVEIVDGGRWLKVGEKADENDGGYMGVHYVGPDCHRRYATPEWKAIAAKEAR